MKALERPVYIRTVASADVQADGARANYIQGGKTKAQDSQAELNYSSDAYLEEQDDAEFSPDQQGRSLRLVGHWS